MISTWKLLTAESQLGQLIEQSNDRPVAIFKHSTTCGTSHGALYDLETNWSLKPEEIDFYYLDLLQYRGISNKIAEILHVTHQSPQLILIHKGKAVYSASHLAVTAKNLKSALQKSLEAVAP